jgi:hypothetical protein
MHVYFTKSGFGKSSSSITVYFTNNSSNTVYISPYPTINRKEVLPNQKVTYTDYFNNLNVFNSSDGGTAVHSFKNIENKTEIIYESPPTTPIMKTSQVVPTLPISDDPNKLYNPHQSSNTGIIVGSSIGGGCCLILILFIVIKIYKAKKKQ